MEWGLFEQCLHLNRCQLPHITTVCYENTEEGPWNVISDKAPGSSIHKRPREAERPAHRLFSCKLRWAGCSHNSVHFCACLLLFPVWFSIQMFGSLSSAAGYCLCHCAVCLLLCRSCWEDEDHAGAFPDSAVCPGSQRSDHQVRQMSQTWRSGQLWCNQGEYSTQSLFLIFHLLLYIIIYYTVICCISPVVRGKVVWDHEDPSSLPERWVRHRHLQPEEPRSHRGPEPGAAVSICVGLISTAPVTLSLF